MIRWSVPRIALACAASLVGLAVAELIARVALPPPPRVVVKSAQRDALSSEAATPRTLERSPEQGGVYVDTATGRRLRPNLRVRIDNHVVSGRTVEITTNSLGLRNRELGPAAGTRILFLGDSITFADYLAEEETFVRTVEALARRSGRHWETVNAGVGGVSLENELAVLVEAGRSVAPDAVVLCFYLNDFHESPGVRISRVPAPLDHSRLLSHLWLAVPRWLFQTTGRGYRLLEATERRPEVAAWRHQLEEAWAADEAGLSEERRRFQREVLRSFEDWGAAWSPHSWALIAPCLEEMRELAGERDFELLIAAFPVRDQVEAGELYDEPQRRLRELAEVLGVPCLDLLPVLRGARAAGIGPLFYDHCHHTPEGSAVVAGAIDAFLVEHLGDR